MSDTATATDDELDENPHDTNADEPSASDEAATAKEADAGSETPELPPTVERREQRSIVAGLAAALPIDGSLLVVITKRKDDELLVTVQPAALKHESALSLRPLQLVGGIDDMAERLLDALAHYAPARQLVIAAAEQVAKDTANALATAKQSPKKPVSPTPAAPKVELEKLLVNVEPALATVVVKDAAGKPVAVQRGKRTDVPVGTYTVSATAEGYRAAEPRTVELKKDSPQKIDLYLLRDEPSLLDGF